MSGILCSACQRPTARTLPVCADCLARLTRPVPEGRCLRCGGPIPPRLGRRGAPRRYCDQRCRLLARNERQRDRERERKQEERRRLREARAQGEGPGLALLVVFPERA